MRHAKTRQVRGVEKRRKILYLKAFLTILKLGYYGRGKESTKESVVSNLGKKKDIITRKKDGEGCRVRKARLKDSNAKKNNGNLLGQTKEKIGGKSHISLTGGGSGRKMLKRENFNILKPS